jgi:hypothetical protein
LKKQSQFATRYIGTKSYLKGIYVKLTGLADRKNKAKRSQYYGSLFIVRSEDKKWKVEKTKPI